ncbi:hypothetical protein ALC53_00782 [Atta colombica]|uniref:Uncharacterized protein n=1 Tax=Atta colombica TaxID=520822 RepID=A0A195BUR8_9HYME|nr:hypothetical protein ALC53_00782 [Atta colombica]
MRKFFFSFFKVFIFLWQFPLLAVLGARFIFLVDCTSASLGSFPQNRYIDTIVHEVMKWQHGVSRGRERGGYRFMVFVYARGLKEVRENLFVAEGFATKEGEPRRMPKSARGDEQEKRCVRSHFFLPPDNKRVMPAPPADWSTRANGVVRLAEAADDSVWRGRTREKERERRRERERERELQVMGSTFQARGGGTERANNPRGRHVYASSEKVATPLAEVAFSFDSLPPLSRSAASDGDAIGQVSTGAAPIGRGYDHDGRVRAESAPLRGERTIAAIK